MPPGRPAIYAAQASFPHTVPSVTTLALITDATSLDDDYDMPPLRDACQALALDVRICNWDDPDQDWSRFSHVVLRSPWDYTRRPDAFLDWCAHVSKVSRLVNPLSAVRWSLDKHYLADLARAGVAVIPSTFIESKASAQTMLDAFLQAHPGLDELVVKPTVGASSRNVRRFLRADAMQALQHAETLLGAGHSVILQPYLASIERQGETDLVYINGIYSHAIRKAALLARDGTTNAPTLGFLSACEATATERALASAALQAASRTLGLDAPLLYARVDLIHADDGQPQLLELEILEPSLSFPLAEGSAMRFAQALAGLE